jgi:hypothetical protein
MAALDHLANRSGTTWHLPGSGHADIIGAVIKLPRLPASIEM